MKLPQLLAKCRCVSNSSWIFLVKGKRIEEKIIKKISDDYTIVGEAKAKRPVNRWLELKNDETRSPNQKLMK